MSRTQDALKFCRKIALDGAVLIPSPAYLATAFGWSQEEAEAVLGDLVGSGALECAEPGWYHLK